MVHHLIHGYRQGAVVALKHHAERVADQDDINAGFADELGKGRVIGGQGRESLALLLVFPQGIDGNSHRILAFWVDGRGLRRGFGIQVLRVIRGYA